MAPCRPAWPSTAARSLLEQPGPASIPYLLRPEKVGALIRGRMALSWKDGLKPLG
jgi:hypothetical protein